MDMYSKLKELEARVAALEAARVTIEPPSPVAIEDVTAPPRKPRKPAA